MEAINYAPNGQNMALTEDAQIVQGVSGNACYLPAGTGKIPIEGDRNELSVSLWRQWDGVVETDAPRGVFSFKNIQCFFDHETDLLTVVINDFKAITDIKDDQKQAHWCFIFAKNNRFTIYKDSKTVYELSAGDKPVDMTDGFTLGGGKTHATFDEVRLYKTVLKQGEINGLFYLVSKGTQVKQLEKIVQSATPKYLGVTETVPTTRTAIITKGERLGAQDANPGDWVLMAKTVGGWKVGVCYRWTGSLWANLEPEANYTEQYQACLLHICEIEELMKNTGHFGALFAKALVAQKALIDELLVNQAFIKNLVVQKLRIDTDNKSDQDFEADINEDVGISVRYKNTPVFEVSKNGRALFSGDIKTPSFELKQGDIKSYDLDFSGQCVAETVPNEIFKSKKKLPFIGYIKCSGTFGNKNIVAVASYIQDGTKTYNNVIVRNHRRERGVSVYYIGDATYATKVYNILVYYSDNTIAKVQDTIVQRTCIDKRERQSFEYFLNSDTEDKYNVFSPPYDDSKPKMKISVLKIKINDNATTMKVINLPNGDGSYESGSIYVENGFLKVHL